jgi:hypothetical protein
MLLLANTGQNKMKKNIFEEQYYTEILNRIKSLEGHEKPIWGKMDLAQMLAHCIMPLEVAAGERTIKKGLIGWLLKPIIKKAILSEKPFQHNTPTTKEYNMAGKVFDVSKEKELLIKALDRFIASAPTADGRKHPIIGAMSAAEWGWSQYKHLDHHLSQFGK